MENIGNLAGSLSYWALLSPCEFEATGIGRGAHYLEINHQIFAVFLHTNGNRYTKIESCININNALILTFIHQN